MKIKNSIIRIIKAGSLSIWGTALGVIYLFLMFIHDYNNNHQIDGYKKMILIITGFMIYIWLPTIIFYLNYLLHTGLKTYIIDLNKKSIMYFLGTVDKKIDFQDICEIIKTEHISQEKQIENAKNFWDRLENLLGRRLLIVPWSKFSYIKISGKNGDVIYLTSLMTNYEKFPMDNVDTSYVRFPLIKK